jgi:hypothetical protein
LVEREEGKGKKWKGEVGREGKEQGREESCSRGHIWTH